MNAASENHLDFAARVQRIQANTSAGRQLLFVGVDEVYSLPRNAGRARHAPKRRLAKHLSRPLGWALALSIGTLAFALGEVLRFHLQGILSLDGLVVSLGFGLGLALALGLVLSRPSVGTLAFQALGVAIGLAGLPDAVKRYPDGFAALTSEQWVAAILAQPAQDSVAIPLES